MELLHQFANHGTPLSRMHLEDAIKIMISHMEPARRRHFPFTNERPGARFLRDFFERHSAVLMFGRPRPQEANRFQAANPEGRTTHFAVLEKLIQENNIDAAHMFNLDEAGSSLENDVGNKDTTKRILPRHGCQDAQMAHILNKNRITLMAVISAAGDHAPPFCAQNQLYTLSHFNSRRD